MMWAACCLGFFAFLRAGEFTLPSVNHIDPAIHLAPVDIAVEGHSNPMLMRIRLKYSKTDQETSS